MSENMENFEKFRGCFPFHGCSVQRELETTCSDLSQTQWYSHTSLEVNTYTMRSGPPCNASLNFLISLQVSLALFLNYLAFFSCCYDGKLF